jgi:hypothetical protein
MRILLDTLRISLARNRRRQIVRASRIRCARPQN